MTSFCLLFSGSSPNLTCLVCTLFKTQTTLKKKVDIITSKIIIWYKGSKVRNTSCVQIP